MSENDLDRTIWHLNHEQEQMNKENVFEPLIEELREAISHRNERIIALQQEVSDHRAKHEKLRELASHNLDEREKLINGICESLKFLKDTRHSWNGPIHRATNILEGLVPVQPVQESECEDHDYIYIREELRHECKHCGKEPELGWYDIFGE